MSNFDYLVMAIVGGSGLLGLIRGLIKEVLSLLAFLLAFLAAIWWGPKVSGWIAGWLENDMLRAGAAYATVFFVVLLSIGLFNMLLSSLIARTGLTPADHGLGAVFGIIRGLVFVLALVTLAGYTELTAEPWFEQAQFAAPAIRVIQTLKTNLPHPVAEWLPY
ncbi:CvpA family protein [Alcaligenes endophyticus]|uniref:CvpA family protein n=1 Tax=Alcaligenes endophyticus TaxID=1929088 RepID=A0ABT8EJA8_9BURK|nr:CvpA family protein [Alcaligenes endophyticus]MCX5591688.1 CvpA family protein [Alcaligenes endophyticus]MDN4121365.1 CvpA family protein [Alcaligenes endophyticus]